MRLPAYLFVSAAAVVASATPVSATAQPRAFAVVPGHLREVLDSFARQSGLQIIYRMEDVHAKTSGGVRGSFEPEDALQRILSGTTLEMRKDQSGAIAVVRSRKMADAGPLAHERRDAMAGLTARAPEALPASLPGEDIVVTALKNAGGTNVQNAPLAITALGAAQIEQAHIQSISDITKLAPNVFLNSTATLPGLNNFSIRGMAVYSSIPSSTPTVGVFLDGVYLGSNTGTALQNTFDLEGIEVLRGPQGLLFGRNVTAGAVLVRTTEPSARLHVTADAGIESGLAYTLDGVVSGPVNAAGTLSAKLGVFYNEDTGYFTNSFDGAKVGKSNTEVVRVALKYDAPGGLVTLLRGEYGRTSGDGPTTSNHRIYSRDSLTINQNTMGFNKADYGQVSLENRLNVDFGDGQIVNIAAWRQIHTQNLTDADSTPATNFHLSAFVHQHQLSDELRYSGKFGPVSATVGAFVYTDALTYVEGRDLTANTVHRVGGGRLTSSSWAVFSNFDIEVLRDFTLNLGARYSGENKHAKVNALLDPSLSPCSTITQTCTTGTFDGSHTWYAFTPRVGLDWKPSRDTHFYGFYTKGFRSGGYNLRQTNAKVAPGPYDQEQEQTFELGVKQRLANGRVRLAFSAFQNKYTNLQRDVQILDPVFGLAAVTANTADVTIRGLEGEATVEVLEGLTLNGNVGYLDATIDKLLYSLSSALTPAQQMALKLPFLAPWSYGFGFTAKKPFGEGNVTLGASFQHVDRVTSNDLNNGFLNPVDSLDVNLTYAQGPFSISGYIKNALDKVYYGLDNVVSAAGDTFSPLGKARVFGLKLRYRM